MSRAASPQAPAPTDPKKQGPRPEYPQNSIEAPGSVAEMSPKPDHGEDSYQGLGRLKDRVALITGGDSGIGRAVAIAFAREGADVVLSYLPEEEEDAAETVELVQRAERKAVTIAGDIRDEQHCAAMVDRVYDEFGKLDILVNNAAFQMTHDSIEEFSTEEFDRTFKTNVYAMFWLCRAALPRMQPGSAIINTASIQAFDPSPNLLAYAPTKAAIVELYEGAVADRDEERRAGQRGRARSGVDTAHPVDDAGREGEELREGHLLRTCGAADRDRAGVRVPRLERSPVRHG